jgi:hypothetical protein
LARLALDQLAELRRADPERAALVLEGRVRTG